MSMCCAFIMIDDEMLEINKKIFVFILTFMRTNKDEYSRCSSTSMSDKINGGPKLISNNPRARQIECELICSTRFWSFANLLQVNIQMADKLQVNECTNYPWLCTVVHDLLEQIRMKLSEECLGAMNRIKS